MSGAPTERFGDRVADYAGARPGYPAEVLAFLAGRLGLAPGATIADVGSGTGISSRLLLEGGYRVVGVEPNAAMRAAAEAALAGEPRFASHAGTAERTGLDAESVDAVLCAQSFHWFERDAARTEFHRILRQGAPVILLWNRRQRSAGAFAEAYEALLARYGTDYAEVARRYPDEAGIRAWFRGGLLAAARHAHAQWLDLERLMARAFSSSYTPAPGHPRRAPMEAALARLFAAHAREGRVRIDYDTCVYAGLPA